MTQRAARAGSGFSWRAVATAIVVLAVGVYGSVLAARSTVRTANQKADRSAVAMSEGIASTLRLRLEHEQDLLTSTAAYFSVADNSAAAPFSRWIAADRIFERYDEVTALGRIVVRRGMPRRCVLDRIAISPRLTLGAASAGRPAPMACGGQMGAVLAAARDSGRWSYEPITVSGFMSGLGMQQPLYVGGTIPSTLHGRRAAYIGSVTALLNPASLVYAAVGGNDDVGVTLRYRGVGGARVGGLKVDFPVHFHGGVTPPHGRTTTIALRGGWVVQIATPARSASILAGTPFLVLGAGVGFSLALALLLLALATSRSRALRMVEAQTLTLQQRASELDATIDELEAARAARDEFLGTVSHELRSPLTSIQGYLELLQDDPALSEEQRRFLSTIERAADRLLALVEDLLLITKLQSGDVPLELYPVRLDEALAASIGAAAPTADAREVELVLESAPAVVLDADARKLGQALDNLVSNAIKYTAAGGRATVSLGFDDGAATIVVADTGMGIPLEEQQQLFTRFFRSSNVRESEIGGTGLGLAITRAIIEAHHGTIDFESREGVGTTFRIVLPGCCVAELEPPQGALAA
jgi:signal transduction histidine kinase